MDSIRSLPCRASADSGPAETKGQLGVGNVTSNGFCADRVNPDGFMLDL